MTFSTVERLANVLYSSMGSSAFIDDRVTELDDSRLQVMKTKIL